MPETSGADGIAYGLDHSLFWIDCFHPYGAKQHTAFAARTRADVDAFYDAGLRAGGTANGAPGLRDVSAGYPPNYYAAFLIDPDGNNIEAVCRKADGLN